MCWDNSIYLTYYYTRGDALDLTAVGLLARLRASTATNFSVKRHIGGLLRTFAELRQGWPLD